MVIQWHTTLRATGRSLFVLAVSALLATFPARAADLVVEGNLTVEEDAQVDGDLTVGGQITAGTGANLLTDAAGLIDGAKIQTGTVGNDQLSTVNGSKLVNGTVTNAKLGADAVKAVNLLETENYTVNELYATTKLGIGTTTVPHGGVGCAKLALDGPNQSTAGPFVQFTTAADNYPVMMFAPYAHDNMGINFDTYFNGAGSSSSDAGSNVRIIKWSDHLITQCASGVAAGNSIATWMYPIDVDLTNGRVRLPRVPFTTADDDVVYINADGRLGLDTSSIRYKENVRDAAVEDTGWIHALRPVMFDYKDHTVGTNQCGLIAEEVAEVHPAIVRYQREVTYVAAPPSENAPGGYASETVPVITTTDVPESVRYHALIVPMLAEIQRLKTQVDALETRLAALEAGR